jgi:DNA-binding CsgD family transcriptional regulator
MRESVLVGRNAERETMRAARDASLGLPNGRTRTVVIGGEAGIGKTRLVNDFLQELPANAIVGRGQCVDLDQDAPPFAPVIQLLRSIAATVGDERFLSAAGPARDALTVLLPELGGEDAPERSERAIVNRLYDGVAVTLERLSQSCPLVIVIEDIHWADQATIGLLRFLVRVVEDDRILFLLSYRSDEIRRTHPIRAWLSELTRNGRVELLALPRLSAKEVRQMVKSIRGVAPSASALTMLHERTGGVPFFVEQLAYLDDCEDIDLPTSLSEVLLSHYAALGESSQYLLRLLAAGGVRVEHSLLSAVSTAVLPGGEAEIDAAARDAIAASILVVDDTAYEFRHALVRDAIHGELLPGERVRFHTAYARALEQNPGIGTAPAAEVSHHWMAAHDIRGAFSASAVAMEQARESSAFNMTARMGERILELWDRVPDAAELAGRSRTQILATTAHALRNAGESDRAISLVDEAIAMTAPDDVLTLAPLLRDKASYYANVGKVGSVELLRESLALLDGDAPGAHEGSAQEASVLRATVLGELAARLMLDAKLDEAIEVADLAYAEAEAGNSRARMSVAVNIRGVCLVSRGRFDEGLDALALAGELAKGNDSARLRYWVNLSDAMNLLGRFREALALAQEGENRARLRGVQRTSGAILMSNMIEPLLALGEWDAAEELLDRAFELEPPLGFSAHLQRIKLWSTLWRGRTAEAERLLRSWRTPLGLQQRIDAQVRLGFARAAAEIELESGNLAQAWADARAVIQDDHQGLPAYDLPLLMVAARVLAEINRRAKSSARRGDADDADASSVASFESRAAEERLRLALTRYAHWPTAPIYVATAEAELGGEDHTGTDAALWSLAAEAAETTAAPAFLRPYASTRLAEALAAAGDRAEAIGVARLAREQAEAMGAGLITARLDALERRIGSASAPSVVPRELSGLTARERQVLALIAQGLSNKQIADQLFISIKTASVHVSNILRKLGAASRTEAAFMAQPGLAVA